MAAKTRLTQTAWGGRGYPAGAFAGKTITGRDIGNISRLSQMGIGGRRYLAGGFGGKATEGALLQDFVPGPVPTTGGARERRPRLELSFSPGELEARRFQARLPRLKREDEVAMRAITDFLKRIN